MLCTKFRNTELQIYGPENQSFLLAWTNESQNGTGNTRISIRDGSWLRLPLSVSSSPSYSPSCRPTYASYNFTVCSLDEGVWIFFLFGGYFFASHDVSYGNEVWTDPSSATSATASRK